MIGLWDVIHIGICVIVGLCDAVVNASVSSVGLSLAGALAQSVYRNSGVDMAMDNYDFFFNWNWNDIVDGHRGCMSTLWTISRWKNGIVR